MEITSKVDLCNLGLGHLGNYGTVSDIDTPTNDKEITMALWYDITRQDLLKRVMPNFSLERRNVALIVGLTIPFGYTYAYEYPTDCLKILGIGDVDLRSNYIYSIEKKPGGTGMVIYTDEVFTDGLPLRFIKDVQDVNSMSPEFKMLLSWAIADNTSLPITQDINKQALIKKIMPIEMSEVSGLNAQENKPIRISNSLFQQARYADISRNPVKR